MSKLFSRPLTFFIIIAFIFLVLRFFNIQNSINYGSDAARDFLVTWNMYVDKHPVLIGPPSEYTVNGRQFFFGPAPYYIILPALLVGDWDPLSVSYYVIFLNLAALLISLIILNKNIKEKTIIYSFALFCTVTPGIVTYTQSYWNPYFMFPVSLLLVALIVKSRVKKTNNLIFLLIGFLFGLGLQFHYSFIFAIILSCVWLFFGQKTKLQPLLLLLAGFVIGFSPLILFELRNHFYNLNTMLLVMTHPSNAGTGFIFNTFYFISLFPFFFYWLAVMLKKVMKQAPAFIYIFWTIYIVWSLFIIVSPHSYALSYPDAKQLARRIEQDNPKNFNVVDQLTRDNRATPIRYLLTVDGFMPQGVTDYSDIQTLYIYSKQPLPILLKNPIYEIKSFLPFSKVKTEKVSDKIHLYKLTKNK